MVGGGVAFAALLLSGCGPEGMDPVPESPDAGASSPVATPTETPTPTTTPDPWAGHFTDAASSAAQSYVTQFYGSFGDPGGVGPSRNENSTLEPGSYGVSIACAGPDSVMATVESSAGVPLVESMAVPCSSDSTMETALPAVDLPDRGLVVTLDSEREPGAYLIRITQPE